MRMLLPMLALLAACSTSQTEPTPSGRVLYVEPAEDGEWDDPGVAGDYRIATATIQEAIDLASFGDVIEVPSGTYTEDLVMKDGVSVRGAGMGETFLEGKVLFIDLDGSTTLSRMTVLNPGTHFIGIGVDVIGGSAKLEELEVAFFEKGVQIFNTDGIWAHANVFLFNDYGFWADLSTNTLIQNNIFRSNAVSGLTNYTSSGQVIYNTLVANAFAGSSEFEYGGALQFGGFDETEVVANNIVVNNFYGINCQGCGNDFTNNLVWGNTTNYANDASQQGDDLNLDPQFASAAEFDFTLTVFSPAIDSANSAFTIRT